MAGLRSSRRVQIKQGDQRTRLPAVACRSSARSSGNFGARPAREAGGNAVGQVHPKRCEARELTGRSISPRVLTHGPELLRTRVALRAYQRRTLAADALIASTYLSGTNTRRVRRALKALFGGAVSKDTVSRIWRKVKADWESWNARSLADEPIVRLILDGTVVRVRLDRKATSISLL